MALSSWAWGNPRRHVAPSRAQLGGERSTRRHTRTNRRCSRHSGARNLSHRSWLAGDDGGGATPSDVCNSRGGKLADCRLTPHAPAAATDRFGDLPWCGVRWWTSWWRRWRGGARSARGRWGAALACSAAEPLDRLRSRSGAACAALLAYGAQLHLDQGALRLLRASNHFAERCALKWPVHVMPTRGAQD